MDLLYLLFIGLCLTILFIVSLCFYLKRKSDRLTMRLSSLEIALDKATEEQRSKTLAREKLELEEEKEKKRKRRASLVYVLEQFQGEDKQYSYAPFDFYRCIFVHIPKTGGISLTKNLFGNRAGGHATIRDYQKFYPQKTFDEYFKFSVVRDPYNRLYSAFNFLKKGGLDERDQKWANENLLGVDTFEEFVLDWLDAKKVYSKNHLMPQFEYLVDEEGKVCVDFIGKLENLGEDYMRICKAIGVEYHVLEHRNASSTNLDYMDFYTNEMKLKVFDLYKKDFELFDYCV